jgi:regulator of replication initiation timing
MQLTSQN